MQRKSFDKMPCPIARSLERVGEWWSILILRDALHGLTRFDQFQKSLGIAPNMLTRRLNGLVDNDILKRVSYQDHPPRWEYRLTAKGRDLWHVVIAMRQWGDRWAAPDGPPLKMKHTACGHVVQAVAVCSQCGERLDVHGVSAVLGPGASEGDLDHTPLSGALSGQ